MAPNPLDLLTPLSLLLLLLLLPSFTLTSSLSPPSTTTFTLDPNQLKALQSINFPTSTDPCSPPTHLHNSTTCDSSKPFHHLLSLRLSNCSYNVTLSTTALKSLSSLTDLQFINCPISPVRFPSELTANLRSFTCINCLKTLTGDGLNQLQNLTTLTISGVNIADATLSMILGTMKNLNFVSISQTGLTGYLPDHWQTKLTQIDLSSNNLKGKIPSSLSRIENLEYLDLSSNSLYGEIPGSFGDFISLQNVSLASNSLFGQIPDSLAMISGLVHLDLGSNQLNGTIPGFLSEMKQLKYLNLEKNNFEGVLPFNGSFIKRLEVFKVGGNSQLCFNDSTISSKEHGIDRCRKRRMHAASKIVLGVAIGLSSIVFVIIFLVVLSKYC
ncbi:unnamed protein product [Ilex paraguariensis]|uniref:Uncharacterized protein n=1 Tax=Ilex paraguariensis TaxID=185542 RepID=A0ABC8S653_9AQUA